MEFKLINLFILTLILPSVIGERILLLTPIGSKSHKLFFTGAIGALPGRGHQITILSAFAPSKNVTNVKEIVIPYLLDHMLSNVFENKKQTITNVLEFSRLCIESLTYNEVQELKKEKFDLVILSMFFSDCYLTFIHELKVPFIYASPAGLFGPFSDMINNIEFPSFVANSFIEGRFPLTFYDRFLTVAINTMFSGFQRFYLDCRLESECKERGLWPEDMTGLRQMRNNASLAILNSIRSLEVPARPVMPNIIYAGGSHIKPAKPLNKELEDWVNDSGEHGFIFFSLGSALKPSFLPEKYRKILINVFGSLKQKVLWKWDQDTMPDLPKNVKLSKWLPQQDILGHSKLQLFITHGGLLSTFESTYFGVRVIGMPVFADQFSNMKEAEKDGWGRVMKWKDLNEEGFRKLILDTINDDSLIEVSKRRSKLMRDLPIDPDQEAAFWIEYVLRHKGAPHIVSPIINMRWYEVYNMDVWTLIGGILLGLFFLLFFIIKSFLRLCGFFKTENTKTKRE